MDLQGGGRYGFQGGIAGSPERPEGRGSEKIQDQGDGRFGSAMRGRIDEAHDIDILVDFEEEADLLDLVGLGLFLEEKVHRQADVVPKRALRAELRESVLREVATL